MFDIEQVTDEQLYEHLRYVRLKQHWYYVVFEEEAPVGKFRRYGLYVGYPEQCLSRPRIDEVRDRCKVDYGMSDDSMFLHATYLGHMTQAAFTGPSNDN